MISAGIESRVSGAHSIRWETYVLTFPCTCKVAFFSPSYHPPIKCYDILWIDVENFVCIALSWRPPEGISFLKLKQLLGGVFAAQATPFQSNTPVPVTCFKDSDCRRGRLRWGMCTGRWRRCNHHFRRLRYPDQKWLILSYEDRAFGQDARLNFELFSYGCCIHDS